MSPFLHKYRGTGVALITPFSNGKIDWAALERHVENVITGGVEFLVALGSTGEASVLSEKEQRQVLDCIIQINRGRLPLVAGNFGGSDTAVLVQKIRKYDFSGIDALLSSSPGYLKPTQEGIFQHYMALAAVSPLPIIIYNVPGRTASNISAETTLRLAHASTRFLGIKDASDDLLQIMCIIEGRPPHFLVFSGDDFLALPVVATGGDGVISVIGNMLPKFFSDMIRAGLRHDLAAAIPANLKCLKLFQLLFSEGNPAGVKAALEIQGVCRRELRLPNTAMSVAGVEQIRLAIQQFNSTFTSLNTD